MRAISADALNVIQNGASYKTRVTVTTPGGSAINLKHTKGWSVTGSSRIAGTRLSVPSLQLTPTPGVDDLFALAGYPGAVYDLAIGIDFGAVVEWIPTFHGYAVEGSTQRNALGVNVGLTDPWLWADDIPFETPFETTNKDRANLIDDLFTQVISGLTVAATASGGTVSHGAVYTDRNRGQAAEQLAVDGLLQAGFNASGALVIKEQPDISGDLVPVANFIAGDSTNPNSPVKANITAGSLERTRQWSDTLINAVTVKPGGDWQTWTAQTAKLADTSDPRHESKVGFRNVEIISNTIDNACDALLLAERELTRRLRGTAERVRFTTLLNPALEEDDPIWVAALPILDDPGWNGTYITSQVIHSPKAATTTVEAISAAAFDLGT